MPLPNNFYTVSNTFLTDIDQNFAALGALTPIPSTLTGSPSQNFLFLNPSRFSPLITNPLQNYQQFTFIATQTNTGPVVAQVASVQFPSTINPTIPAYPVYKDTASGPVPLTGGEIIAGMPVTLMFDQALNGGAGGFHLGGQSSVASGFASYSTGTAVPQDASGASLVLTAQQCWWTQIGNMCFVRGSVTYPSNASGAVTYIAPVSPFPVLNASSPNTCVVQAGNPPVICFAAVGTTVGTLAFMQTGGTQTRATNANLSGLIVQFNNMYQCA
jgi:hypothetical protein